MEEYWDIYDKYRRKTGKIIKRNSDRKLQRGEYHIVITGIIQNSKNQILITRRREDKEVYPGLWECTNGSAIAGEKSLDATIREIREEIGIELKKYESKFLGTMKGENYFRDVWGFRKDIEESEIQFCDGEVIDFKWISVDEYQELYKKGQIVPSGDIVVKILKEKEVEDER